MLRQLFQRKPHTILFLTLLLAIGTPSGSARAQAVKPEGTIVAMGDSLTEGLGVSERQAYPAQLEKMLRSGGYAYRVVNAGISGETSSGARSRLRWVLKLQPDIVILETGANDGLRGIDPALIRENIAHMLQQFAERDVVVVLAGMKMLSNLGPEYTAAFEKVYEDAARGFDVIRVPFILEGVAGNSRLNQADGIHPTAEGYTIISETLYPYVIKAIKRHRRTTANGPSNSELQPEAKK